MKKILPLAIFAAFFWSSAAYSVPKCYEKAEVPAHEFPFVKDKEYFETVSLDPADSNKCLPPITVYKGKPLVGQLLYAPLLRLYKSYFQAMKDEDTMRKIAAYLRPSPRDLYDWFELSNEGLTPQKDVGGRPMMGKIIRLLAPNEDIEKDVYINGQLRPYRAWPLIFLYMGGELVFGGESAINGRDEARWLFNLLQWRFPTYVFATGEDGRSLILK